MTTWEEDFGGKILCAMISTDLILLDATVTDSKKDDGTSNISD